MKKTDSFKEEFDKFLDDPIVEEYERKMSKIKVIAPVTWATKDFYGMVVGLSKLKLREPLQSLVNTCDADFYSYMEKTYPHIYAEFKHLTR